ncbi:MAG: hypothetical protein QM703_25990 [Gemmatales bacterium]
MNNVTAPGQPAPKPPSSTRRLLNCAILIMIAQGGFLYWLGARRNMEMDPEQVGRSIGELLVAMFFALLIAAFFSRKKPWSYVTAFIVLFVLSSLFFISARISKLGESTKQSAENAKLAERQIVSMNALLEKYAVVFESIKDEETAKKALAQLPSLLGQAQVFVNETKSMPGMMKRDWDALQKRYEPLMLRTQQRLKAAVENIDKLNIDTTPFGEEMLKVHNLFLQLANGS